MNALCRRTLFKHADSYSCLMKRWLYFNKIEPFNKKKKHKQKKPRISQCYYVHIPHESLLCIYLACRLHINADTFGQIRNIDNSSKHAIQRITFDTKPFIYTIFYVLSIY